MASQTLKELIQLPEWNGEQQCPADLPDLETCWRVGVIAHCRAFPPWWRWRAQRTILPNHLGRQVAEWRQWTFQLLRGDHDRYLNELHLAETADYAAYHWRRLRESALASLEMTASWVHRSGVVEVRDEIFRLRAPPEISIRVDPEDAPQIQEDELAELRQDLFDYLAALRRLTNRWNRQASEKRKVRFESDNYCQTLDEFKSAASDEWLQDFFRWAYRCAELNFGLYLDY